MATKPTYKPEWATDDVELPISGNPNKVRPEEALRNSGYDQEQHMAAEEFNWMFNNIYSWVDWIEVTLGDISGTFASDYYDKTTSENLFVERAGDTITGDITWDTGKKAEFGTSMSFGEFAGYGKVNVLTSVFFENTSGKKILQVSGGATPYASLYYNDTERVKPSSSGADIVGVLDVSDSITTGNGVDKLTASDTGTAPHYAARAWVHFNGSSGVIDASGNVASVLRIDVGDYNIHFTEDMPDTNYVVSGSFADVTYTGRVNGLQAYSKAVDEFGLTTGRESGADNDTPTDFDNVMLVIHR